MVHTLLCIASIWVSYCAIFCVHDLQLSIVFRIFSFEFFLAFIPFISQKVATYRLWREPSSAYLRLKPVPARRIVIDSYVISELIQYLQVFFNCSRMDAFVSRSDRLQ